MNNFADLLKDKPDQELMNMVYQSGQWSTEMLQAVEQELTNRNILPDDLDIRKQEIIDREDARLSKGVEAHSFGQVIGWVTVAAVVGIVIGYNYSFSKVTSKYTGKEYFKYDEASRKNGNYLFYTSLLLSGVAILYRVIIANGVSI